MILSIMLYPEHQHIAGIILIFLQHNDVGSENCEKSVQILQATRLRKYKVDKDRIFLELDTLIPCPVHFGISKAWLPPYARLSSLYIVRRFTLLALAHEMFNWIIVV